MNTEFQIDKEFLNLSVPITEKEQEELERSILQNGCLEPITVWQGIIIDGHKRYKFCSYEEIEFAVIEMEFRLRDEAIEWACLQKLPDVDKKTPFFRYLVGKMYKCRQRTIRELQKIPTPEIQEKRLNGTEHKGKYAALELENEIGVNHNTLELHGSYSVALDVIAEKDIALFRALTRGDVKIGQRGVIAMSKMDAAKLGNIRRKAFKEIEEKNQKKRNGKKKEDVMTSDNEATPENNIPIVTGIKEMPAFDPDKELKGLTFTIPAWINVMAKTEKKINVETATNKAKENLIANLYRLQEQVYSLLEVLE